MRIAIGRRALVVAALAACPAYFVFAILLPVASLEQGLPSYDFYAYFYPNILHAIRSYQEGFGLFWNPYQNCGQPFFAFSLTALLYPPNGVFFLLDREAAMLASMLLNATLGGVGAWLLFREMRLGVVAAIAGAVAFEVGTSTLTLTAWGPMHIAPHAWMPWALFGVERLLQRPTQRSGMALAAILAVQLLPGFPLPSLFTVQLIGLRVLFALVRREVERPARLIVPLAIGLGAAPLLVAIQYVPSLQVALESVRASGLEDADVLGGGAWSYQPGLATAMLAGAALLGRQQRGLAGFYLAVGSVFAVLSLGKTTPLFELYTALPLGDLFVRRPSRFLWVTGFALSALVAIGVDAIGRDPGPGARRAALPAAMVAVALLSYANPAPSAGRWEWVAAGAACALAVWGAVRLPGRAAIPWGLALVVAASGLYASRTPVLNLRAGPLYERYEETFALLRDRMTPQDRVLLNVAPGDLPLVRKTASVFRVPAVGDYEPQTSRRMAEYTVWRKSGRPMRSLGDFLERSDPRLRRDYSRPLVDLAAARYLVVSSRSRRPGLGAQWKAVARGAEASIYENRRARPRAGFVPQLRVVASERVLATLDAPERPLDLEALVEAAPASGFLGTPGGAGSTEFVEDRGERVVLRVRASQPGFLHLADQYFPGWKATVNGEPAEILRANYVFRVVEVPAGESTVVFEYGLTPVYVGTAISLLTIVAGGWLWWREARASIGSGARRGSSA